MFSEVEEANLSFNEFQNLLAVLLFDLSFQKQLSLGMGIKDPIGCTDTALTLISSLEVNIPVGFCEFLLFDINNHV